MDRQLGGNIDRTWVVLEVLNFFEVGYLETEHESMVQYV